MPVAGGEVCYGGAMGIGLARTLLWGRANPDFDPCAGRVCGDDGCGGSCGSCSSGEVCTDEGACVTCEADCTGRECGDDGCGGSCGTCGADQICSSGQCEETPDDCTGDDCSNDDCTGDDCNNDDCTGDDCTSPTPTGGCSCVPVSGQALPFLFTLWAWRRRRSGGRGSRS